MVWYIWLGGLTIGFTLGGIIGFEFGKTFIADLNKKMFELQDKRLDCELKIQELSSKSKIKREE